MTEVTLRQILDKLLELPCETECVEFKEAKNTYDFAKLGKYFSSLANEANLKSKKAAWLIFGVKDKPIPRAIVGSNYRPNRSDLDSLKAEIANKTTNRITFTEIYEVVYTLGRVILFEIPAAPIGFPIVWEGHYYGRDGEDIGPLNLVEIEQIRSQATRIDWSAQLIEKATITDLDEKAIRTARDNYKTKFPKLANEVDLWDTKTFLNKAKVTIAGKITNAAIVLFLIFCKQARSRSELLHFLGLKNHSYNYQNHIEPLLHKNWIERTHKDNLKDRNQKYRLTLIGRKVIGNGV
jgi:ATP-dependent DNA helicase RecG